MSEGLSGAPGNDLRLGGALGQGAVATVVRVTDEHGSAFAGKILHESHGHDPAAQIRFAQEAELATQIVHDNVVRVHGRRQVQGRDVLVMELVQGEELATWIARRGLAPEYDDTVLGILAGIVAGLAAAHAAGIVHRDLKPSNVLLAGEVGAFVPKIADFGMARASSLSGVGSDALTVLGTPDYMGPETLDPLAVDGRTDLYALGCIAFEMLVGRPPYQAATPFGILQAHRSTPVPALPAGVPPALAELVTTLLAKSPADRPQAAQTVADALESIRSGGGALVRLAADASRCARCDGPLVDNLRVCLGCGMSVVVVTPGDHTVIITGPGDVGDKLDSRLRDALLQWMGSNPRLGLVPTAALERRIPRLPFPLSGGVSEQTALALVQAAAELGLQAQAVRGGALRLPAMRAKARSMAGRVGAIVATSIASLAGSMARHPEVLLVALAAAVAVIAFTVGRTLGRATQLAGDRGLALSPPIQGALRRVEVAAPGIDHARHREALRAVVGRALALSGSAGDDAQEELATAIDAATAAAGRLDALDRELSARGSSEASDESRALLHERDLWSARLLRLSATLDSLAARAAAAKAIAGGARDDDDLAELRLRVEALEEVQAS